MLGANNILDPKDGKPIVTPSQDMVLGNYYLTLELPGEPNEGKAYKDCFWNKAKPLVPLIKRVPFLSRYKADP